ncbi:MAG: zinc ribbon domain-containing protein [Tomitella sp.]|nr:zinc ribbon domain-containing protein [Tomitella sp.]
MPVYQFRCNRCGPFDSAHPMTAVPDADGCPRCGESARRAITAPALNHAASSATRLLDSTARSASEPAVVSSPPPRGRPARSTPMTTNPLHRTLPRP